MHVGLASPKLALVVFAMAERLKWLGAFQLWLSDGGKLQYLPLYCDSGSCDCFIMLVHSSRKQGATIHDTDVSVLPYE